MAKRKHKEPTADEIKAYMEGYGDGGCYFMAATGNAGGGYLFLWKAVQLNRQQFLKQGNLIWEVDENDLEKPIKIKRFNEPETIIAAFAANEVSDAWDFLMKETLAVADEHDLYGSVYFMKDLKTFVDFLVENAKKNHEVLLSYIKENHADTEICRERLQNWLTKMKPFLQEQFKVEMSEQMREYGKDESRSIYCLDTSHDKPVVKKLTYADFVSEHALETPTPYGVGKQFDWEVADIEIKKDLEDYALDDLKDYAFDELVIYPENPIKMFTWASGTKINSYSANVEAAWQDLVESTMKDVERHDEYCTASHDLKDITDKLENDIENLKDEIEYAKDANDEKDVVFYQKLLNNYLEVLETVKAEMTA